MAESCCDLECYSLFFREALPRLPRSLSDLTTANCFPLAILLILMAMQMLNGIVQIPILLLIQLHHRLKTQSSIHSSWTVRPGRMALAISEQCLPSRLPLKHQRHLQQFALYIYLETLQPMTFSWVLGVERASRTRRSPVDIPVMSSWPTRILIRRPSPVIFASTATLPMGLTSPPTAK